MTKSVKTARHTLEIKLDSFISIAFMNDVDEEIGIDAYRHYLTSCYGNCIGCVELSYALGIISFDEYLWLNNALMSLFGFA